VQLRDWDSGLPIDIMMDILGRLDFYHMESTKLVCKSWLPISKSVSSLQHRDWANGLPSHILEDIFGRLKWYHRYDKTHRVCRFWRYLSERVSSLHLDAIAERGSSEEETSVSSEGETSVSSYESDD
jgi:hypothetical protein